MTVTMNTKTWRMGCYAKQCCQHSNDQLTEEPN